MDEEKDQGVGLTIFEEDFYKAGQQEENILQLVVFRLSKEWYGVDIQKTRDVIRIDKITPIPSMPEYIRGIVNIRGNILAVTDLKRIFHLPEEKLTVESRLLVIESNAIETGLLVDGVLDVMRVPVNLIAPTLTTISADIAEYLDGEYKIDNKLIGILKVEKILDRSTK